MNNLKAKLLLSMTNSLELKAIVEYVRPLNLAQRFCNIIHSLKAVTWAENVRIRLAGDTARLKACSLQGVTELLLRFIRLDGVVKRGV